MAGSEIYTTVLTMGGINQFTEENITLMFDSNVYSFYITDVWVEFLHETAAAVADNDSVMLQFTDVSQTGEIFYNSPHLLFKYSDSWAVALAGALVQNPVYHFKFKPGMVLQQKKLFISADTAGYAAAVTFYIKVKGMRIPKENGNVFYSKAKGLYTHVNYVPFVFTAAASDAFGTTYVNMPGSKSATKDIVGVQWEMGSALGADVFTPASGDCWALQVTPALQTDILDVSDTDYGWAFQRSITMATDCWQIVQTGYPMTYINPKVRITNQEYAYVSWHHIGGAAATVYGRLVVLTYSRKG